VDTHSTESVTADIISGHFPVLIGGSHGQEYVLETPDVMLCITEE